MCTSCSPTLYSSLSETLERNCAEGRCCRTRKDGAVERLCCECTKGRTSRLLTHLAGLSPTKIRRGHWSLLYDTNLVYATYVGQPSPSAGCIPYRCVQSACPQPAA
eukprot:5551202-Pleurochrysis_carterae.AAC.2